MTALLDRALLEASITAQRAGWTLEVDLSIAAGSVTAMLGPNGAGKTTTLHILAGLMRTVAGRIVLGDEVVDDPATGRFVAPEQRCVGLVFQDYLLFPRMTVRDNISFGLRARGIRREPARRVAEEWLERMELHGCGGRRPADLSGGQAQRVALARALAVEPRLLLLDEPLSALDVSTRMSVRSDLRRHLAAFAGATVLVSHDPLDALVLADRIVVIENGRVVQQGSPTAIARHPRTAYVAQLVGLNLFRGRAEGNHVTLSGGATLNIAEPTYGEVFVVVAPSAIAIFADRPHGSPRNSWPATITGVERQGHAMRVAATGPLELIIDVTAEAVAELGLDVGIPVWLSVKATELVVYPVEVSPVPDGPIG